MILQVTPEAFTASLEEYYAEQLINYVIDGWIDEQIANELARLPFESRKQISDQVIGVSDADTACGDHQRALWATGILGREIISQSAKAVFVDTASLRPIRERKQGLGERVWTCGRHSSPDTFDW